MMTAASWEDKCHSHMQDRLPETAAAAFSYAYAYQYDLLKRGLVEMESFKVPPKRVKNQHLSSWSACPKYLCTQVCIVNAGTWKPRVGVPAATALSFCLEVQEEGNSLQA